MRVYVFNNYFCNLSILDWSPCFYKFYYELYVLCMNMFECMLILLCTWIIPLVQYYYKDWSLNLYSYNLQGVWYLIACISKIMFTRVLFVQVIKTEGFLLYLLWSQLLPPFQFNLHIYTFHACQCKTLRTYIFSFVFVKIIKVHINKIHTNMNLTRSHMTMFLFPYKSQTRVKVQFVNR